MFMSVHNTINVRPQNATFQQEIHHWSTFCQDLKDKSSSLFDAFIKMADPDYYPSIRDT
jgi:NADH:ubiquinone oxidoreductase subunit C